MQNIKKILITYRFTTLIILAIWVLCLVPFFPETPLDDVPFIDKWTHFVMYGGLCAMAWLEYGRRSPRQSRRWTFVWFFLLPLVMGGLIEIVQATCTGGHRSGDVMDWAADAVGVVLGQLIGIPLAHIASRWNTEL